jgi:hypothetical protein
VQGESGGWFIEWGFLPLMDRRILAMDGCHKLSASQWAVTAEAERSGEVTIIKAGKDNAYARTRQIKIFNAVDRETDKYTTKPLKEFPYPIQALATVDTKASRQQKITFTSKKCSIMATLTTNSLLKLQIQWKMQSN